MILADETAARAWFAAREDFDAATLPRLEKLAAMLRHESCHQNLVSAASLDALWTRHFADSAQLLEHVPRETAGETWLDLGSGAGFPGVVIAICQPERQIILAESRAKRIAWLEKAVHELALECAIVAGVRLEKLKTLPAFVISARAFAQLPHLVALSARFSTPQTRWLLPKGRGGRQELAAMPKSIQKMFHVEQSITDPDSVILVGKGVPDMPRASVRR